MTVQVKDILHERRQTFASCFFPSRSSHDFPRLSFLTPVNILIKNCGMEKATATANHLTECINHD